MSIIMPNRRFKRFIKSSEEHLRFYVLYLSHLDDDKVNNDFRNISLYDVKELQHNFIELVALRIGCHVDQLESGELPRYEEDDLNDLLDELIETDKSYLITQEHTDWLQSDREVYFLISMLKIMRISRINLTQHHNESRSMERWFWPQLNDKDSQKRAQKRKREAEEEVLNRLRNKYGRPHSHEVPESHYPYSESELIPLSKSSFNESYFNKKVDEILQKDKQDKEKSFLERLESKPLDSILEALDSICNLCPTSEGNSAIMVINHLHLNCFTNQISLATAQNLLYTIRNLCIEANTKVPLLTWEMLRTNNKNLINLTYNRLEAQYTISRLFLPSQDTAIQKKCIVSTLDLLSVTTSNFDHRVKLLKDKFSADKRDSKDYSLELNDKQWEMLVDLAGGDTKSKINRTLNKILKDAYKNRFHEK